MSMKVKRKNRRSRTLPMNAAMQGIIGDQLEAFREKFGRDPGPEDPVFFDPYCDSPQPMGTSEQSRQLLTGLDAILEADPEWQANRRENFPEEYD